MRKLLVVRKLLVGFVGHVVCDHVTGGSDGGNELEAPGWSIRSDYFKNERSE